MEQGADPHFVLWALPKLYNVAQASRPHKMCFSRHTPAFWTSEASRTCGWSEPRWSSGTLGNCIQCSQGEVLRDEARDCTALGGAVAVIRPQKQIPNEESW
jgi:hypothetical protein